MLKMSWVLLAGKTVVYHTYVYMLFRSFRVFINSSFQKEIHLNSLTSYSTCSTPIRSLQHFLPVWYLFVASVLDSFNMLAQCRLLIRFLQRQCATICLTYS